MSETPPPPPAGGDPEQQPTTPYPQQPTPQGWQPPYGQPTYGQPPNPQAPYGAAQVPAYGPIRPDHPQATTVLILGIVGIVACGLAAPFAWVMGNRVVREIDASGGTLGGRSNANVGRVCGIVGTALLGLALLVFVAVIIVAIVGTATA
jgi:hypothetical protein